MVPVDSVVGRVVAVWWPWDRVTGVGRPATSASAPAPAGTGALSETADGHMLISATWGLGSAIAQGAVVPDRIVLSRQGFLRSIEAGRKEYQFVAAFACLALATLSLLLVEERPLRGRGERA